MAGCSRGAFALVTATDAFSAPSRLRSMRGLKTDRTAQVVIAGHALMQNLRRGHYELGVEADPRLRVRTAFNELIETI